MIKDSEEIIHDSVGGKYAGIHCEILSAFQYVCKFS